MSLPKIEIHFNKKKLLRHILICSVFVTIGVYMLVYKTDDYMSFHGLLIPLKWLGIIGITFFGLILLFILKKLFGNDPALIIDNLGLEDNSSSFSSGHLLWSDIKSVSVLEMRRQKMILLQLSDAEKHINSQSNLFKRLLLRFNSKAFGGHFSISANGLDIDVEELYGILNSRINNYKQSSNTAY